MAAAGTAGAAAAAWPSAAQSLASVCAAQSSVTWNAAPAAGAAMAAAGTAGAAAAAWPSADQSATASSAPNLPWREQRNHLCQLVETRQQLQLFPSLPFRPPQDLCRRTDRA